MSHGYFESFGQGGFVIHEDDAENVPAAMPGKTMRNELQHRALQVKRTALGSIANNDHSQPFRAAAKQNQGYNSITDKSQENAASYKFGLRSQVENSFPQQVTQPLASAITTQPFNIFCDENVESFSAATSQTALNSLYSVCDLPPVASLASETTKLRQSVTTLNSIPVVEDELNQTNDSESPMVLSTSLISAPERPRERASRWPDRFHTLLSEYSDDIYLYLRQLERYHCAKPDYMARQTDINHNMRAILVDWLVEVGEEYKLHRETLCLAVNYIDRFLSHMAVMRQKLQLLGAASMFLAAKFEEIYPPEVGEFTYITDDTYTKKQVLRMEHLLLKVLQFDVATPTANCFCERFLAQLNADETTASLAMYLVELSLMEADPYLRYLPSQVAASAIIVANCCLQREPWPLSMVWSSGYEVKDLALCIRDLHVTLCRAPSHPQQAIREKYKQPKFCQVSLLNPVASLPILVTTL